MYYLRLQIWQLNPCYHSYFLHIQLAQGLGFHCFVVRINAIIQGILKGLMLAKFYHHVLIIIVIKGYDLIQN